MSVTATDLRKDLFRILDGAAQGNDVVVVHKGTRLRISAIDRGSRLARLVYRGEAPSADRLSVGPDEAAQAKWEAEWKALLAD